MKNFEEIDGKPIAGSSSRKKFFVDFLNFLVRLRHLKRS